MRRILAIITVAAAIAGAAEKFTVTACPISQRQGFMACVTHKVSTMPRFEMNAIMVQLDNGKFVIYNASGWSISIAN